MQYLSPFHGNNDHTNTPQCYVIRTLPVLLNNTLLFIVRHNNKNCGTYSVWSVGSTINIYVTLIKHRHYIALERHWPIGRSLYTQKVEQKEVHAYLYTLNGI
jgi:hypothetical protein